MTEILTHKNWLQRTASWPVFAVLLVLYFLVAYFLMGGMNDANGNTNGPLDLLFSYTPAQVHEHLALLGEAGRKASVYTSATLDTAYPLVYSSLFAVLMTLLTRFLGLKKKAWHYLAFVPFAILAFDLAENTAIIIMTLNFPVPMPGLANAASLFTSLKWIFAGLTIGPSILLGLAALVKMLRR